MARWRGVKLLLVDEYAHTNVPAAAIPSDGRMSTRCGRRHRRVDDLNIQHLESLNDASSRSRRCACADGADTVFDRAGRWCVDFPPDELLKRLAEGKVYVRRHRSARGWRTSSSW